MATTTTDSRIEKQTTRPSSWPAVAKLVIGAAAIVGGTVELYVLCLIGEFGAEWICRAAAVIRAMF